ncbi:MAG: alpha/beta hydrolase [Proteobacteria bacterium]|nr:alpha/beta hydrolase [Pseudomonadota bacterium]
MSAKYLFFLVTLYTYSNTLGAETVSIKVSQDITSVAEYRTGEPGKPLLVFLHGFLQTRTFSTVDRLLNSLHDSGYPVLAPTLSLGISNRAQALPCESIHLHSLGSDTDEIERWISWASERGYKEIVLIGHSAGSVNISAYLADKMHPAVKKSILISLTHYGPGRPAAFETEELAKKAREMLQKGDEGLGEFALAYCKEYVSTAENFLSYYDWSDQAVLKAIKYNISNNYVIIGSADERIKKSWLNSLQEATDGVIVIEGASHFFDQAHEFDLLDSVEEILEVE